jgi:hypothetical protein
MPTNSILLEKLTVAQLVRKLDAYMKGPEEERVKSIFIHFPFSLPLGALKCELSNNTNRIWKNELGPKI